jgi:ABC-type uncharacterized transport system permease subunit
MTTITAPVETRGVRSISSRRIKLTRTLVFGILLILVGAYMLVDAPRNLTDATITTLTFGAGLPSLPVPTLVYTLVVGILYAGIGMSCLLPLPQRLKTILLYISGILLIPTVLIIAAANNSANVTVMLQVSVRLATPIVMGALAGIWCERSGVTNIAIEGMMLTGACFGFVTFVLLYPTMQTTDAQLIGVIVSVLAGGLMSVLHAWLSIKFRTDQVVSGTVINILAIGLTSFMRREVLLSSQAGRETLQVIPIAGTIRNFIQATPFVHDLVQGIINIPVIGQIIHTVFTMIGEVFLSGRPVFYSMFILLIVTHVVLFYTRWGLRTRAVGENPHAADTLGINVIRNRWINVIIGGLIAGLAGAWFSMETNGSFDDNMTSGRGFIALAAMIFGKYMPFGAFGGGLLFGFSDALGQRFQFLGVPVPPQFLQMVPYIVTIVVLAGLVGRTVAPKADGVPYEKEQT